MTVKDEWPHLEKIITQAILKPNLNSSGRNTTGRAALDGTEVGAKASQRTAMSSARMSEKEGHRRWSLGVAVGGRADRQG